MVAGTSIRIPLVAARAAFARVGRNFVSLDRVFAGASLYSMALPMSSTTFLASPNTIMVLSI